MTLPTARRSFDLLLYALLTLVLVALFAETFLRINDLLPALPAWLPFGMGEVVFGTSVGAGLGGTVLLAFTAPPEASDVTAKAAEPARRRQRRPVDRGGRRQVRPAAPPVHQAVHVSR